jgi:hypothetical protein
MGVEENVGKVFSVSTKCLSLTGYLEMNVFVDWATTLTTPITAEAEKEINKIYIKPCTS